MNDSDSRTGHVLGTYVEMDELENTEKKQMVRLQAVVLIAAESMSDECSVCFLSIEQRVVLIIPSSSSSSCYLLGPYHRHEGPAGYEQVTIPGVFRQRGL